MSQTNQQLQRIQEIKETIRQLIGKMGVDASVDDVVHPEEVQFVVRVRDGGMLIGNKGAGLAALNHVVKKMVKSGSPTEGEDIQFFLDVNDYQRQKNESLKESAKMHAQRVRYFKKAIVMQPMSAYDRRIVHSALTEYPDIITESMGEGEDRRVVIKPYV